MEVAQKYREREEPYNPIDLLPGETYAQYFVRQQNLQEEKQLEKEFDDSYIGDYNEASKNLYLIKRAYTDARRNVGKSKEMDPNDPFGLRRWLPTLHKPE